MEQLSRIIGWIGALSPRIWAIYVRRQYVGAFLNIAWAIASLIVICLCYSGIKRAIRSSPETKWDENGVAMLLGLAAAVLLVIAVMLIDAASWSLLSPEYCAIKDLLSVVK